MFNSWRSFQTRQIGGAARREREDGLTSEVRGGVALEQLTLCVTEQLLANSTSVCPHLVIKDQPQARSMHDNYFTLTLAPPALRKFDSSIAHCMESSNTGARMKARKVRSKPGGSLEYS